MIPGVVWLTSKTRYGFTSRNVPLYMFMPFDKTLQPMITGCSEENTTQNIIALVDFVDPRKSRYYNRVNIYLILGKCGDPVAEEKALYYLYSPIRWTTKSIPPIVTPDNTGIRILDVPTISIDPYGCIDIDDCVSVWTEQNTQYVAITIADVSAWVDKNMWLSETASEIGQTLYNDGYVVNPMLPYELSNKLCSLLPGEERRGYSLIFVWNGSEIVNPVFQEVIIKNKHAHTYENVKESTNFPIDVLQRVVSHIAKRDITDPHEWVEQLMIYYNIHVAQELVTMNRGILRGHSEPCHEKITKYTQWGVDAKILANSAATYSDVLWNQLHYGLGNIPYCHATSPIRRWSDVVNQGILKGLTIDASIDVLNKRCKASKKYERDVFFLRKLLFSVFDYLDGTYIGDGKVWVPEWKKLIRITQTFPEGTQLKIRYYLNMNLPTWKKRMVFNCEDTNCLEQQYPEQSQNECPEATLMLADHL